MHAAGPAPAPAPAPATHAAEVFARLLRDRGVTVAGSGEGPAPGNATPLATLPSPPMSIVVGRMLRESDNTAAELLTKELGHRFGGGGSTDAGVGVTRSTLTTLGLPIDHLAIVDGSGLDRSNRVTCEDVLASLVRGKGPLAGALPVAGRDGTLAQRLLGTPAAGRVAAKTGSLEGVVALSGWATSGNEPLAFSLLLNGLAT